jgi:hypothetical protein
MGPVRTSHRAISRAKVTFYYAYPGANSWTALGTLQTNPIPAIWNVYAFNPNVPSHVGQIMYQLNTSSPAWIEWRVPTDPEYQTVLWSAVPRNNPTAEPQIYIDFQGTWQWTTLSQLQELAQKLQELLALEQQKGITSAPTTLVTIGGASETPQALTDLVNGVDRLGGSEELAEAFSNVHNFDLTDPLPQATPGRPRSTSATRSSGMRPMYGSARYAIVTVHRATHQLRLWQRLHGFGSAVAP